jgi:hypothetical protein
MVPPEVEPPEPVVSVDERVQVSARRAQFVEGGEGEVGKDPVQQLEGERGQGGGHLSLSWRQFQMTICFLE